jgi:hypothetical protein
MYREQLYFKEIAMNLSMMNQDKVKKPIIMYQTK